MLNRLTKYVVAAGAAIAISTGALARPASADTTSTLNTVLGAAALVGGVVLYNNYQHKRQQARDEQRYGDGHYQRYGDRNRDGDHNGYGNGDRGGYGNGDRGGYGNGDHNGYGNGDHNGWSNNRGHDHGGEGH
jgi:hypothetical protein